MFNFVFFFNSLLLGVGLAMDAFSVSLANGLNEPCMSRKKALGVAGVFGVFQGMMPFIGWVCVSTVAKYFAFFERLIPWIALVLLLFIGGKMIFEALRPSDAEEEDCSGADLTIPALLLQGLATSIDALSVGLTISHLTFPYALLEAGIIAVVTLAICLVGIVLGKKFGTHLGKKANILGGVILIAIGFEILISSFFA